MWGKVKSSTNSAQMAKYYDKITWGYWPGKEAWKCLIIDEILDDIFQHINQHILIQPNFSHASDTRFKDKIEIKASISLLCVAGELRNDKQSRKEFRFTDRNGIEKFRLLMNQ